MVLGIVPGHATVVLKQLVNAKQIERNGTGKNAWYAAAADVERRDRS